MTRGRDPQSLALIVEKEYLYERRVALESNIAILLFGKERWE